MSGALVARVRTFSPVVAERIGALSEHSAAAAAERAELDRRSEQPRTIGSRRTCAASGVGVQNVFTRTDAGTIQPLASMCHSNALGRLTWCFST